jgi:hypothetical protein
MTADEAKSILGRYRPGTMDDTEAEVAEALEVVRNDLALARWWEGEQEWQRTVRRTLREIQAPATLRQKLLAAREPQPVAYPRRLSVRLVMAAAALFLLCGVAWWIRITPRPDSFAIWRQRMVRTAVREYRMDLVTNNLAAVRQFLASTNGHPNIPVPPAVEALPVVGGAALRFQNQPVSLICFDRGGGQFFWLFATDRKTVPGAPASPRFAKIGTLATSAWTAGDQVFLVAVVGDEAQLRPFL